MPDRYLLRVTAGSEYALSNHTVVPVNAVGPSASDGVVHISTDLVDAQVAVRVRDYRGLPRGSPAHSPYFETTPHDVNGDRYGIAIRFRLKRPPGDDVPDVTVEEERDSDDDLAYGDSSSSEDGEQQQGHQQSQRRHGVSAHDLQFGNDLDHPIRDRLPPGFNTALGILRWWIDPGLDGDAYADRPYLYGPALSSWNVVHVGAKHPDSDVNGHKHHIDEEKGGLYFEEGGHADGIRLREETSAPAAAKDRMKWALRKENKDRWIWEYDRWYGAEFFNPYVDFSEFALRLPGFTLPVLKYWDGKSGLRYVLRNRATNQVYLVILFSIYLKEDVDEATGDIKAEVLRAEETDHNFTKNIEHRHHDGDDDCHHDEKLLKEAKAQFEKMGLDVNGTRSDDDDSGPIETSLDDLD